MIRWEYNILAQYTQGKANPFEEALDAAGKEGWELVSTEMNWIADTGRWNCLMFMKRQLPPLQDAPIQVAQIGTELES